MQNKTEQSNYSIEVDIDSDDVNMHTKLDNRNAISISKQKANNRKPMERNKAGKKIGAIFFLLLLLFCIPNFSIIF